ncbi:MAG: hypothetical protein ACI8RZ_001940 [Myxococcota bacterium]|jgi:hypothetical protein
MRPLLVIVALVAALIVFTLLPLIPDLTVIRQAIIASAGLAGVVLVGVNASKRWAALPDLRGRIVSSSVLAVCLAVAGTLGCLAFSPVGGFEIVCSVRTVRLAQSPTGYDALVPGRTTYRFSRSCMMDDFPESWYRQSVFVFLVGPKVPDQG